MYNLHQLLKKQQYCQNFSATQLREQNKAQLFVFSEGTKGACNTTALIEANVSAECKRPYLELLSSKGKRERHRVRQRERQ